MHAEIATEAETDVVLRVAPAGRTHNRRSPDPLGGQEGDLRPDSSAYAPAGAEPDEVEKIVLDDPEIARRLEGLTVRKVIVVKDRIVNIVAA